MKNMLLFFYYLHTQTHTFWCIWQGFITYDCCCLSCGYWCCWCLVVDIFFSFVLYYAFDFKKITVHYDSLLTLLEDTKKMIWQVACETNVGVVTDTHTLITILHQQQTTRRPPLEQCIHSIYATFHHNQFLQHNSHHYHLKDVSDVQLWKENGLKPVKCTVSWLNALMIWIFYLIRFQH